jgi:hypothetical protein
MDAFEHIVAKVFQDLGYWTLISYKIDFSKEDKRSLDNHSMPRPEIDIVAYRPAENELLMIECKSYLDSQGVGHQAFTEDGHRYKGRYKMFTNESLFHLARTRLVEQMQREGLITTPLPQPQLCLVAGKIYAKHEPILRAHFESNGWRLYSPDWIADRIRNLASKGYENEVMTVVTKILERS